MTHTPGPWVYDEFGYIDAGGIMIAAVEGIESYEFDSDEEEKQADKEVEANGLLMAAAPDLYQALTRLLEIEGQHGMDMGEREAIIELARLAIVKAETRP